MDGLIDTLLNHTALPNLHPAVVHFPIALFPLAVAFDLVVLTDVLRGRRPTLDRVTVALYTLAALSAGAAVWAGERAGDALTGLPESVHELVHDHEEWGEWFFYAAVAVAVGRIALTWWHGRRGGFGGPLGSVLRIGVIAAALAAGGLLVGAADRGGGLVYRSGVSVMAVPTPEPPPEEPGR